MKCDAEHASGQSRDTRRFRSSMSTNLTYSCDRLGMTVRGVLTLHDSGLTSARNNANRSLIRRDTNSTRLKSFTIPQPSLPLPTAQKNSEFPDQSPDPTLPTPETRSFHTRGCSLS